MKALKIIVIIAVVLITIIWFSPYKAILPGYHAFYFTPQKYEKTLVKIKSQKTEFGKFSKQKKQHFFTNALVKHIFPFWYGTRWSFYGNTITPGDGSIA